MIGAMLATIFIVETLEEVLEATKDERWKK